MGLGLGLCCCNACDPQNVYETFDSETSIDPSISIKRNPEPWLTDAVPYDDWKINAGRLEGLWVPPSSSGGMSSGVAAVRGIDLVSPNQYIVEWDSEFVFADIPTDHSRIIRSQLLVRQRNYDEIYWDIRHSIYKSSSGLTLYRLVNYAAPPNGQVYPAPSSQHTVRIVMTFSQISYNVRITVDGNYWYTYPVVSTQLQCDDQLAISLSGEERTGAYSPTAPTGAYLDWMKVTVL